jgi:hypothetical protein
MQVVGVSANTPPGASLGGAGQLDFDSFVVTQADNAGGLRRRVAVGSLGVGVIGCLVGILVF